MNMKLWNFYEYEIICLVIRATEYVPIKKASLVPSYVLRLFKWRINFHSYIIKENTQVYSEI